MMAVLPTLGGLEEFLVFVSFFEKSIFICQNKLKRSGRYCKQIRVLENTCEKWAVLCWYFSASSL